VPRKHERDLTKKPTTCALGGCENRGPEKCPLCKHYTPSRGSRYYYCARYTASRVTCDKDHDECQTCTYYEGGEGFGSGRPNFSGVDWQDPEERAAYMRKYMREYRKRKRVEREKKRAEEGATDEK